MSQVYTFCKNGSSNKGPANPEPKVGSVPLSTNNASPTTGYKQPSSQTGQTGGYSFRKADEAPDVSKPLTFTEDDFPSLGGAKPKPVAIGSWGDASKSGIIREPFPVKVAAPRRDIPPLFKVQKVKKNAKPNYYDEDEDELCDDYDTNSSHESDHECGGNGEDEEY